MKIFTLLSRLFAFCLLLTVLCPSLPSANAQGVGNHLTMELKNCTQPSPNTLQFDVYAISDGTAASDLRANSFQMGINYDTLILQSGATITPTYIVYNAIVNVFDSAVTWASGDKFFTDGSWVNKTITINGVPYAILSVTNDTQLILSSNAGNLTGASFVASSSDFIPPLNSFIFPVSTFKDHMRIVEPVFGGGNFGQLFTMVVNHEYRIGTFLWTSTLPWATNSSPNFSLQAVSAGGKTTCAGLLYIGGAASTTAFSNDGTGDGDRSVNVSCSITLNPGCSLSASVLASPVSCYGASDGSATASVSGNGTTPYTYSWSDGQNTSTASSLVAGSYCVTVTDAGSCTATACATLTGPAGPAFSSYITNEVLVSPTVYEFDLFLLSTNTATFEYAAGQFGITVNSTVASGGTLSVSVVSNSSQLSNTAQVPVNVLIPAYVFNVAGRTPPGPGSGSIISTVNSGCSNPGTRVATFRITNTVPFTCNSQMKHKFNYIAAAGQTQTKVFAYICGINTDITNLGNFYHYDTAGTCLQNLQLNPCACTLTATATSTSVTCKNGSDGTATATASSGTAPFEYRWSDGQTNQTASGLPPGFYTVTVTDAVSCTANASVSITEPVNALVVSASSNSPLCSGNNLNLNSTVSGGVGPYTYSWSGPNFFSAVSANPRITSAGVNNSGTYSLVVTDDNGCIKTTSTSVSISTCTYTITASSGANGSISPSGSVTVNPGGSVTFTITPDVCYSVVDVLVDGSSVGAVTTYTFTNVTLQHSIAASFTYSPPDTSVSKIGQDTLEANLSGAAYQWIDCNTGLPVGGATGQMFIPAQNGLYKVEVTKDGCSLESGCHDVIRTSLYAISLAEAGVKIYPNPTNGIFSIDANSAFGDKKLSIKILDATGRVVYESEKNAKKKIEVNLRGQSSGAYFLKISCEEKNYLQKLIIE